MWIKCGYLAAEGGEVRGVAPADGAEPDHSYFHGGPYDRVPPYRMARRIGVVSVGRSDRGHLAPLLALLPEATVYQHRGDGVVVTPGDVVWVMGDAVADFGHDLETNCPDLLVIFGDRWEQFAAATAAHILGIPMAHLHAGETTEAVYDDGFRNAISALATWHIAAAEPYADKLRQQGYRQVHCLGAPGLSRLPHPSPYWRERKRILVQFHPETKHVADVPRQVAQLALALHGLEADGVGVGYAVDIIATSPGMDAGRAAILVALMPWIKTFTDEQWLYQMAHADVLVGNSSCGIIETPSIPLPSVNIGDRQKGRLMASSVINVPHDRYAIEVAINSALLPSWRSLSLTGENPYGDRHAAQRIAEFLKTCEP